MKIYISLINFVLNFTNLYLCAHEHFNILIAMWIYERWDHLLKIFVYVQQNGYDRHNYYVGIFFLVCKECSTEIQYDNILKNELAN